MLGVESGVCSLSEHSALCLRVVVDMWAAGDICLEPGAVCGESARATGDRGPTHTEPAGADQAKGTGLKDNNNTSLRPN